jgi:F0F1-type ATP synthase assembly protein I
MRHVPLWRAIAETALGTLIGYAVGWFFPVVLGGMPAAPLIFALLGFTAAAVRLRVTRRRVVG